MKKIIGLINNINLINKIFKCQFDIKLYLETNEPL